MTQPVPLDDLGVRLQRALGDGYEVRGVLGQGGFGVVYAAFERSLKREVAVKVLRPEYHDASAIRERFRREAEAAARLMHPNVVPIYSVGGDGDLVWFVMPRVTGASLATRIRKEGPLPAPEVRRILAESVSAIAAAHQAGIIHRDIKPDNILLDRDGRVLLTDFGIAKAADSAVTKGLTQTGSLIGSPQYMSPEQASGDNTLDHRTDIYSMGVVGYEMLTGELPFSGPTVTSVLVKHLSEAAPSVNLRRPDCPPDLAAVVARCLAKAPDDRWASAADLLRALEGTPSAIPRASGSAVAIADQVSRFRRLLAWSAIVIAVLMVIDAVLGRVLLSPLGALISAGVIAANYGRLWSAGYSWSHVFHRSRSGWAAITPPDSAELGAYVGVIRQARSDRAAMVALLAQIPKAGQAELKSVIPTVDVLIARATEQARQLTDVERQIEPGPAELERRAAAVRAEPASPGRNQRLSVIERRREAVLRLQATRARLTEELDATLEMVQQEASRLQAIAGG